jgi:hypothetical protein
MADEGHVIQGINWRSTFPFTHIFRSFRIAIHPSKLLLALALLLLLYFGGRLLDACWPDKYDHVAVERPDISGISGAEHGIFINFFMVQVDYAERVFASVLSLNIRGVVDNTIGFFTHGPVWLFQNHWLFAAIFTLYFLLLWSVFGGAIARIAAVHAARDEKISIRQALKFSLSKVLSYLFAPLIPLLIIVVVGLVVALGALVANIPAVGPIIVGVFFFLALLAGFIKTLVLLGMAGGFNLMYPTIAVEGSDSFDAISRSFSYLYARPWRLLWYTLVAVAYGALTYLFIKAFIWLTLLLTCYFCDLGVFVNSTRSGGELWSSLWPFGQVEGGRPGFGEKGLLSLFRLTYTPEDYNLYWGGRVGAYIMMFWNYLVISMLGAYAISYYFSSNTIIYYLMRQEVDATELDDVYVEQAEDEFVESPATTPATTTATPASTGATPATGSTTTTDTTGSAGGTETTPPPQSPAPETPPPGEQPPPQGT